MDANFSPTDTDKELKIDPATQEESHFDAQTECSGGLLEQLWITCKPLMLRYCPGHNCCRFQPFYAVGHKPFMIFVLWCTAAVSFSVYCRETRKISMKFCVGFLATDVVGCDILMGGRREDQYGLENQSETETAWPLEILGIFFLLVYNSLLALPQNCYWQQPSHQCLD